MGVPFFRPAGRGLARISLLPAAVPAIFPGSRRNGERPEPVPPLSELGREEDRGNGVNRSAWTTWSLRLLLLGGLLLWLVTFWTREALPPPGDIRAELLAEPVQEPIPEKSFSVDKGRLKADFVTRYRYAIAGLVVGYYDSDVWHDYTHRDDPFNTKDLCLLWGGNVRSGIYRQVEFSHGEFTCFCRFSREMGPLFDLQRISNNHLIPATPAIADRLRDIRSGDQVAVTGQLVDYRIQTPKGVYTRATSTVRNDHGCEIIFADSVTVLRRGNPLSASLHELGFWLALAGLAFLVARFLAQFRQQARGTRG